MAAKAAMAIGQLGNWAIGQLGRGITNKRESFQF